MGKFAVRKNTLPYVYQWAVIDTDTGDKIDEYKTQQLAEKACSYFTQYGLPDDSHHTPQDLENVWSAMSKRMRRPCGNNPPKPNRKQRYSTKRKVELD